MSLSFDKIIERITDENKVYRNKFIEPFDMMATKVEEMKGILQKEPTVDTESGEIITQTKMNEDPLKNITKEQRLEVLDKVLADLNSRKFQTEERLDFLNEKILKEVLSEKEIQEIATLGNLLSKMERQEESIQKAREVAVGGGKTGIGGPGY